jgi:hypothetical protein
VRRRRDADALDVGPAEHRRPFTWVLDAVPVEGDRRALCQQQPGNAKSNEKHAKQHGRCHHDERQRAHHLRRHIDPERDLRQQCQQAQHDKQHGGARVLQDHHAVSADQRCAVPSHLRAAEESRDAEQSEAGQQQDHGGLYIRARQQDGIQAGVDRGITEAQQHDHQNDHPPAERLRPEVDFLFRCHCYADPSQCVRVAIRCSAARPCFSTVR